MTDFQNDPYQPHQTKPLMNSGLLQGFEEDVAVVVLHVGIVDIVVADIVAHGDLDDYNVDEVSVDIRIAIVKIVKIASVV
ncbi:hypothetical protein BX616_009232 [Lobosporangium transversale]|nr:hypothetical protein BX616_009232 [Lobosporangium transversale]